jgi:hypothetical protein
MYTYNSEKKIFITTRSVTPLNAQKVRQRCNNIQNKFSRYKVIKHLVVLKQ